MPTGERIPCDGAVILARVGQYAVQEREVLATVNEQMELYLKRLKPEEREQIPADQLRMLRTQLIQQALRGRIETLVIYQEAKRNIPAESWDRVESQLEKEFEDTEVDRLIKQLDLSGRRDLDRRLRELGTSLETRKRTFCETYLAHMWLQEHASGSENKTGDDITRDEMLRYYRQHQAEFTKPARASWEELMVSFEKHPKEADAYAAICRLGNEVLLAGRPFADVARAGSDGVTANDGGRRNWTCQGSLVCKALDGALFSLPVGKLSPVIRSANGFHIIRVTEREDAAQTLFLQAQADIKKKIVEQRSKKQTEEYLAELIAKTPVWTIFDDKADVPEWRNPRAARFAARVESRSNIVTRSVSEGSGSSEESSLPRNSGKILRCAQNDPVLRSAVTQFCAHNDAVLRSAVTPCCAQQ